VIFVMQQNEEILRQSAIGLKTIATATAREM